MLVRMLSNSLSLTVFSWDCGRFRIHRLALFSCNSLLLGGSLGFPYKLLKLVLALIDDLRPLSFLAFSPLFCTYHNSRAFKGHISWMSNKMWPA